jgi:hypothetical protein
MLEGAPGVVRRVNEDALHAPGIKWQQSFQRIEVVALDQPVRRIRSAMPAHGFKQPIRHVARSALGLRIAQPGQLWHGFGFLV